MVYAVSDCTISFPQITACILLFGIPYYTLLFDFVLCNKMIVYSSNLFSMIYIPFDMILLLPLLYYNALS